MFHSLQCGGAGGLLHDHSGNWVTGFADWLNCWDVLKAEVLAVYHGLLFAWARGFCSIICEMDFLESYNVMSLNHVLPGHSCADTLHEIRQLCGRD